MVSSTLAGRGKPGLVHYMASDPPGVVTGKKAAARVTKVARMTLSA